MFLQIVVSCPVTSLVIAGILFVWSKSFLHELDLVDYATSFKGLAVKGQWWRLLTAPWFHHNPAQMMMNVFILWQCRHVEQSHGSWFVLRYTILLAFSEGFVSILILYLIAMGIRARNRWQQSANAAATLAFPGLFDDEEADGGWMRRQQQQVQSLSDIIISQPFGSKPKAGFSGISLAWTSFMMVTYPIQYFYILGVLPVPSAFAPVIIIFCVLLVEPQHQTPSQSAGFTCGLLLALGVLQIEPNFYWTACFTVDVVLLLVFQYFEAVHIEACRHHAEAADNTSSAEIIGGDNLASRFVVPQSLLALRSDSDEGLVVRHWDCPGPTAAAAAAADSSSSSSSSSSPDTGASPGAAEEGIEMSALSRVEVRDEEGESKEEEWESLLQVGT